MPTRSKRSARCWAWTCSSLRVYRPSRLLRSRDHGPGSSAKVTLPVRRWADCSGDGYLLRRNDSDRAPAPEDLRDQHAFYAQVPGPFMVPGGINQSDYCLIFPFAQLEVDQRGWFLKRTGEEAIKWVMRLPSEGLDLGTWELDTLGHSKLVPDRWKRADVVDRGVVVAVYHERPSVERPLAPASDWHPDALSELGRSALFSSNENLKAASAELDMTVSAVDQIEMRMKPSGCPSSPYGVPARTAAASSRRQTGERARKHPRMRCRDSSRQ